VSAPTAEGLERIRADREAGLLRQFAYGRRLAMEEMSVLQHLLPVDILSNPPAPTVEYLHAYAHYASLLKCDVRQIKRYVQIGREAKPQADFPPLDRAGDFPSWWRRHHKGQPSPAILAFAATAKPAAPPVPPAAASVPAAAAPSGATVPGADLTAEPIAFDLSGVGGFEASVRELRATAAAAQIRLRRAMGANPINEELVSSYSRAVEKQIDLLRKAENDLFDFQKQRGELVSRTEVREDWRTLIAGLRQMRRRMRGNVVDTLLKTGKFSPELVQLVGAAIEEERAREEKLLCGSVFWRRTPDHASADTAAA
jgi:hypothetical protein